MLGPNGEPGLRVDRAPDDELVVKRLLAFENQRVCGAADEVRRAFLTSGDQAQPLAVIEQRALAKVGQQVTGQVVAGLGVIRFGRFVNQESVVQWSDASGSEIAVERRE